jgi:hypothetical protein
VFIPPLPQSLPELGQHITTATSNVTRGMLHKVWDELDYFLNISCVLCRGHVKPGWSVCKLLRISLWHNLGVSSKCTAFAFYIIELCSPCIRVVDEWICVKYWWKEYNRKKPKHLEKTSQRATLSTTYPMWTGVGSNLSCLVRGQWLTAWAKPEILCSTEHSSFILYKPTSAVTFNSSFDIQICRKMGFKRIKWD